jgi:hypothetical protein
MSHGGDGMKRALITAALAVALAVVGLHELHGRAPTERFLTNRLNAGDVVRVVMATVSIEVARRDDVLRAPTTALRWVPTPEMFKVSHQPVPPELKAALAARNRPFQGSVGYVWELRGAELHPLKVTLGLTDGTSTEATGPGLTDGLTVVTGERLGR